MGRGQHLLAELLDGPPPLDEVLEEFALALQVARGEQPQVDHQVVRGALVVEGGQQVGHGGLLLHLLDQVHELRPRGTEGETRGEMVTPATARPPPATLADPVAGQLGSPCCGNPQL